MGFFDLAVELRFHIYNLLAIAIPHSAPFSEYRGFYYTCRQIKCEIDQECGRFLRKHITLLQKNWKATTRYAHFGALPETWPYWSLQHIYLTLDPHAYFRMKQTNDDGFLPILNLHLESVSLALFVDSKSTASWEDDGNWIFYWVINQLERRNAELQTRRIVLYLPKAGKKMALFWLGLGIRRGRYAFRWNMAPGNPICGIWELKPLEESQKEQGQLRSAILVYLQGFPYMGSSAYCQ